MAYDPNIRVSDADRDRAASLLREHHAAGRLTTEEFNERLDAAFVAKTVGDLNQLMADLPGIDLYRLPDAALTRQPRQAQRLPAPARSSHRHSGGWRAAWGCWFTVSLLCTVIWAVSGAHGSFWPVWVAGPWGAVLAGSWLTSHAFGTGPPRQGVGGGMGHGELPGADDDLPGRPGR